VAPRTGSSCTAQGKPLSSTNWAHLSPRCEDSEVGRRLLPMSETLRRRALLWIRCAWSIRFWRLQEE
ncbi:unnamed protein product, partial [Polarella glacialis]